MVVVAGAIILVFVVVVVVVFVAAKVDVAMETPSHEKNIRK